MEEGVLIVRLRVKVKVIRRKNMMIVVQVVQIVMSRIVDKRKSKNWMYMSKKNQNQIMIARVEDRYHNQPNNSPD